MSRPRSSPFPTFPVSDALRIVLDHAAPAEPTARVNVLTLPPGVTPALAEDVIAKVGLLRSACLLDSTRYSVLLAGKAARARLEVALCQDHENSALPATCTSISHVTRDTIAKTI